MRSLLLLSSAALYWLLFMAIHESGHILAAFLTGGHVTHIVLHPLALSRTDVSPNPHPMAVCWTGPLWGAVAPLVLWAIWRAVATSGQKWLQGLAGFCLIANGAYLASGIGWPAGDTDDLLRMGVRVWWLPVVGVPLTGVGLVFLHRLGPRLGTGQMSATAIRGALIGTVLGLMGVSAIMVVCGARA